MATPVDDLPYPPLAAPSPKQVKAAVVLCYDSRSGRVLTVWNAKTGERCLPGGKCEDGGREPFSVCAVREMIEETGWRPEQLEELWTGNDCNGSWIRIFFCRREDLEFILATKEKTDPAWTLPEQLIRESCYGPLYVELFLQKGII